MAMSYNSINAKTIYNFFKDKGLTDAGAVGLMANIYCESKFLPNNAQNSGNKKLNMTDEQYTAGVDNGTYTNFIKDKIGYGLCQWTYWTRKQNMLNYARSTNRSIGDMYTNLEFLWQELSTGYKAVLKVLMSSTSYDECARYVMLHYEKPANQSEANQKLRAGYAKELLDSLVGNTTTESTTPDTPSTTGNTYTVKSGDTLSKIGKALGVAWKDIATANNIKSPYSIKVGQVLTIPTTTEKEDPKYTMIKPVNYYQTDLKWKSLKYAADGETSTIGSAGCGPTAMAMVLASLVSPYIDPVTTSSWSRMKGYKYKGSGTAYSYFVPQAKEYGITVTRLNTSTVYGKTTNAVHEQAKQALINGNWVIACMGKGNWTSSGHYILVYGYQDGNVYINDPASSKAARTCNTFELFKSQVKFYWVVEIPTAIKSSGKIKTTGTYREKDFVREVQFTCGAGLDGSAGSQTLSKTVTVSRTKNRKHKVVMALQKKMHVLKYYTGNIDGSAGPLFETAVKAIQAKELNYSASKQDGEITAKQKTWKWFLGML